MISLTRLRFTLKCYYTSKFCIEIRTRTTLHCASLPREVQMRGIDDGDGSISLQEWQGWGTTSPVPADVKEIIDDLKLLENDIDAHMIFGGKGGKLKGDFGIQEDKKHRATYQSIADPSKKIQFFSARQIACRVLGCKCYLCQKCWLPHDDCMCSKVIPCTLWHGIRFWLYMHPKDFLRQNNTGKLLWQVFGPQAAVLCLYGISEHEQIMWDAFKLAGKDKVWCLYPNKNAEKESVLDIFGQVSEQDHVPTINGEHALNFILLDGTWNNSAAMLRRLKEQAKSVWGEKEDLPCISLTMGASAMHKLRPQPSWDRTCTAAAAIGLLYELHDLSVFRSYELDKQADAAENALEVLLEALTSRRIRLGRSITRKVRHNRDIY